VGSRFLKAALRDFAAYTPGLQPADGEGWVKLNTNESPWPPSPRVIQALHAAVQENLRLYPDPLSRQARAAIARHHNVGEDQVALGNGGDELIELCFRAFSGAGDRVALMHPSYPLYEPVAAMHECRVKRHPYTTDHTLPESFATDAAPLKFLVNPNSPTGTWLDREAVLEVVRRSAGVVALDEAYVDFAPEARTDLIREGHENLLIIRTLSKSYALAGMRLGYALGSPELIAALDLVKDSYNVSRLGAVAAVAAIEDGQYHDALVECVLLEREWLTARLRQAGFEVLPSATNFVFCRPPASHTATDVAAALTERRILVRHYTHEPVARWLRITVGRREQHQALLTALEEIFR